VAYAVDREVDDLAAVIQAHGGRAALYGHSSGAGLVLHAAALGLPLTRRTLVVAGGASPEFFRDTAVRLARLIPNARYRELPGESHDAAPAAVARAVQPFVTR
jgi:pimeloyl-ACP methyl ester carboxylesterase